MKNEQKVLLAFIFVVTFITGYKFLGTMLYSKAIFVIVLICYANKIKLNATEQFFFIPLIFYAFLSLVVNTSDTVVFNILYWFGLPINYLFLKILGQHREFFWDCRFLIFLSIMTIAEFVAVNFLLDFYTLKNGDFAYIGNTDLVRATSFANNASISSSILATYFWVLVGKRKLTSFAYVVCPAAMITTASGAGLILFAVLGSWWVVYKLNRIGIIVLLVSVTLILLDWFPMLEKTSWDYVSKLYNLKVSDAMDYFASAQFNEIVFGTLGFGEALSGSHFGWLDMTKTWGVLGVLLVVGSLLFAKKISVYQRVVLTGLLLSCLHYPTIFSSGGQFLAAMLALDRVR